MVAQNAGQGLRVTPMAPPALHRTIALAHRSDVVLPGAAQEFRRTLLGRTTPAVAKA